MGLKRKAKARINGGNAGALDNGNKGLLQTLFMLMMQFLEIKKELGLLKLC